MIKNENEIESIIKKLNPDTKVSKALYQFLANCILKANSINPIGWVLYSNNGSIVFFIRDIYTLCIGKDMSWQELTGIAVMASESMLNEQIKRQLVSFGCTFGRGLGKTGDSIGVIIPSDNVDYFVKSLNFVQPAINKFISNVLKPPTSSRPGMSRTKRILYEPEITQYLRDILGISLPDPAYHLSQPIVNNHAGIKTMNIFDEINDYLQSNGYYFTPTQISTFYTALQTKGLVILSGISGTGKTKLAQYFAEMLRPNPIALVGAVNQDIDESDYPGKFEKAEYWTYPIREDVVSSLLLPFHLYINRHSEIKCVFTVSDYRTQPGAKGMISPWPNITDPKWQGKDFEEGHPEKKFKTWFRYTRLEKIDNPLSLPELEPLFGYSNNLSALRAGLIPVKDPISSNDNTLFLSVRPDWRDSKSLLGYYNPLTKTYEWTAFLRFLEKAVNDYQQHGKESNPWFVILDEMNLARVEYYFADLLSVLESGRDDSGCTKEALHFQFDTGVLGNHPPKKMFLPPNLYIIGTVNVDETTQSFSPKVLDRAFSIEFTDVDFDLYVTAAPKNDHKVISDPHALSQQFTREGHFACIDKTEITAFVKSHKDYADSLQALNLKLQPYSLHFGYRVFDEIIMYLKNADENKMEMEDAFDQAVLMKVLPKFHGSRGKLEKPLKEILLWCAGDNADEAFFDKVWTEPETTLIPEIWPYKATADRVRRMFQSLKSTGFTSFG